MPTTVRSLTDFLQHSGQILPEIEQGEVVLRRRDGDDLVIVSHKHWEALCSGLLALAEAYCGASTADCAASSDKAKRFALPWLSLLVEEDRSACYRELVLAAIAAIEFGRFEQLDDALEQWRATALATWDEERRKDQAGYWDNAPVPLERP